MKIALISDIHANYLALEAVLKDIESREIDVTYCLGDLVGYAPFPNEVINLIIEKNIPTVQGNYDQSVGENRFACGCDYSDEKKAALGSQSLMWSQQNTTEENKEWLKELPQSIEIDVDGVKILLVHGSPRRNNEYLYKDSEAIEEIISMSEMEDIDFILCGHTHVPYHMVVNGTHIANVGSVGKPKHGNPNATYIIVDIMNGEINTEIVEVEYDFEKVAKAIEESDIPSEFADKIRKGIA